MHWKEVIREEGDQELNTQSVQRASSSENAKDASESKGEGTSESKGEKSSTTVGLSSERRDTPRVGEKTTGW
jgi:hypothetical protein